MRQGRFLVTLAVSALLTACSAPDLAGPTNSTSGIGLRMYVDYKDHTDTKDVPWDFYDVHPCNGDYMTGAGLADYRIDTSHDTNGTYKYNSDVHQNAIASGDPSGKTYKIDVHSTYQSTVMEFTPAYKINQVDTYTVTGPTSKDGYKRVDTFKIEVDQNGFQKVFVDTSKVTCGK
jgi:hypothetical protein